MTSTATDLVALYRVRKNSVEMVDVPELGYLVVEGAGAPDGQEFGAAVQALYAVAYGARFAVKRNEVTRRR